MEKSYRSRSRREYRKVRVLVECYACACLDMTVMVMGTKVMDEVSLRVSLSLLKKRCN